MQFSTPEIKELLKAWIAVSFIFALAYSGFNANLPFALVLSFVTAGIAFVLHELAHKYIAQYYSCYAEFRANDQALIIGLVLSIFGFVLAAPGAVCVRGASKEQHGRIALAGPLANIILALISSALLSNGIAPTISMYAFKINALLAVFNLLPLPAFDGRAVFDWNKTVSISMIIAGVGLFYVSML